MTLSEVLCVGINALVFLLFGEGVYCLYVAFNDNLSILIAPFSDILVGSAGPTATARSTTASTSTSTTSTTVPGTHSNSNALPNGVTQDDSVTTEYLSTQSSNEIGTASEIEQSSAASHVTYPTIGSVVATEQSTQGAETVEGVSTEQGDIEPITNRPTTNVEETTTKRNPGVFFVNIPSSGQSIDDNQNLDNETTRTEGDDETTIPGSIEEDTTEKRNPGVFFVNIPNNQVQDVESTTEDIAQHFTDPWPSFLFDLRTGEELRNEDSEGNGDQDSDADNNAEDSGETETSSDWWGSKLIQTTVQSPQMHTTEEPAISEAGVTASSTSPVPETLIETTEHMDEDISRRLGWEGPEQSSGSDENQSETGRDSAAATTSHENVDVVTESEADSVTEGGNADEQSTGSAGIVHMIYAYLTITWLWHHLSYWMEIAGYIFKCGE